MNMDEMPSVESPGVPFWMHAEPDGMDRFDEKRVRRSTDVRMLCVVLPCPEPVSGVSSAQPYSHLETLMSDKKVFPDLERVQVSGHLVRWGEEGQNKKVYRATPAPVMNFLASRKLKFITLSEVSVPSDLFVSFCGGCRLSTLYLSRITITKTSCGKLSLPPRLEALRMINLPPETVEFVAGGINKMHQLHVTIGNECGSASDMIVWDRFKDGTGGRLVGVRALTWCDPRFDHSTVLFQDLKRCDTVKMLNLVAASFDTYGFSCFINYISDFRSPIRQLGMTHWNLVDGFGRSDEFDEFLTALTRGNVVWYSHRRLSSVLAERVANALPAMRLEALELEIIDNKRRGGFVPTQQLLQAARSCYTLGVFKDPMRAARAEMMNVVGLSATGTNRYDYEWFDHCTYFDVFSEEERAELERLFRRNQELHDSTSATMRWLKSRHR